MTNIISKLLLFMLFWSFILGGCSDQQKETRVNTNTAYYAFNSETILNEINSMGGSLFQEVSEDYSIIRDYPYITWSHNDYKRVVDAFLPLILIDNANPLQIREITSSYNCGEISYQLQKMYYVFFQDSSEDNTNNQNNYQILIFPKVGKIVSTTFELQNVDNSKEIPVSNTKFSVESLLDYVDKNGGKAIRESAKNQCTVDVRLFSETEEIVWWVYYFEKDTNIFLYSIKINDNDRVVLIEERGDN
jgi:hypothetical protein